MAKFKKRELSSDQPLGKQLRAVRQTAKLNLDQVAAATKIQKKFIQALENGKYDQFPAEVYARGFLENYAKFLGFPTDEVLLQYKRERGVTESTDRPLPLPQQQTVSTGLSITPRTMWLAMGALSLFIAVSYLITQVSGFARPPKLELTRPVADAQVTSETVEIEGRTDPGADLSINNQPVPIDTEGEFKERVRLLTGTNTLRVAAKNKRGRERVITRSVVVKLPETVASASPTPTPAPSGVLMTLKIGPNSAYVTVNVDGQNTFTGLLLANTEQTFSANSRILLTTSNGGSTRVFINGVDKGPAGREGQFRRGIEYKVEPSPAPSPAS